MVNSIFPKLPIKYSNTRQESSVRVARHSAEFGLSFCWRSFLILCRTEPAAVKEKKIIL